MPLKLKIPQLKIPQRLDKFLIEKFPQTTRQFWKENLSQIIRINHQKATKGVLLKGGETITLLESLPKETPTLLPNPKIELKILYEDPYLIAVDKPPHVPCHPLRAKETATLVNGVVALFPEQAKVGPAWREGGLVFRLDNETSGVVLLARNSDSFEKFRRLSQQGGMKKTYLALVEGKPNESGVIDLAISHHPKNKKKMLIHPKGRKGYTEFTRLQTDSQRSLMKVVIWKGNRHQIRVHFAAIGHPVVGDVLYGRPLSRHYLHAHQMEFFHPFLKKNLILTSPPPPDFIP